MKSEHIQLLLLEIQKLESKVANLKKNQSVSFSFFRESFKQTQEIHRLLHELEFIQIEDMKSQMEKLVHFLSESETTKPKTSEELENIEEIVDNKHVDLIDENILENQMNTLPLPSFSSVKDTPKEEVKEEVLQTEDNIQSGTNTAESIEVPVEKVFIKEHSPKASTVEPLSSTNKSLNDKLHTSHTILDIKQSISLNDRFLFQRELFDNDRLAMNNMMIRLQAFKTFEACEGYLKENTKWNFKDETVEKFLEMLKKTSK